MYHEWIARLTHADDVPWWLAKVPATRHRCKPQSDGWRGVEHIERCACGAVRVNDGTWINRNARRAS
jgi:hypothetical protein